MIKIENNNKVANALDIFDAVLAPMAGYTDLSFRTVCLGYGSYMMYTEMISAKGLCYNSKKSLELMEISKDEPFTGIQLFGSDADFLSQAVYQFTNNSEFAFVDLNLGCSVRKITKNGDGSALALDLDKMAKVVAAMSKASTKPITAKIRISPLGKSYNFEVISLLEECGVCCIAVHGRTKNDLFSTKANWDAIAEIVSYSKIPIIANGDVNSIKSFIAIKEETGAYGIMIGRWAIGNPLIFSEIRAYKKGEMKEFTYIDRLEAAKMHLERLISDKGYAGFPTFKKHFMNYTKGMNNSALLRRDFQFESSPEKALMIINNHIA